jgi:hypothetical protein
MSGSEEQMDYATELASAVRYVRHDTSKSPLKLKANFDVIFRHIANAIKVGGEKIDSSYTTSHDLLMAIEEVYMTLDTDETDDQLAAEFIFAILNKICVR